jgi:hypothetical protein
VTEVFGRVSFFFCRLCRFFSIFILAACLWPLPPHFLSQKDRCHSHLGSQCSIGKKRDKNHVLTTNIRILLQMDSASGFSFINAVSSSISPPLAEPVVDILLFKAAEAKQVKKKKRAPKVGFGRGDDEAEEGVEAVERNEKNDSGEHATCATYESSMSDSISQPESLSTEEAAVFEVSSMYSPSAVSQQPPHPDVYSAIEPQIPVDSVGTFPETRTETAAVSSSSIATTSHSSGIHSVSTPSEIRPLGDTQPTQSSSDYLAVIHQHNVPFETTPVITTMATPDGGISTSEVDSALAALVDTMATLSEQRIQVAQQSVATLQQIADLERSVEEAIQTLATMEADQQLYATQEDYDKADALNEAMDAVQRDISSYSEQINSLFISVPADGHQPFSPGTSSLSVSDSYRSNSERCVTTLLTQQMAILEETKSFLERAVSADETANDCRQEQVRQEQVAEERRLRSEAERIALARSHVDEEDEALQEHLKETETAISAQVSDATEQKEKLDQQLSVVLTAIDDLEKQLLLKREQARELTIELAQAEGSITEVRRKFQRQLQHIDDRRKQVASIQEVCVGDADALDGKWAVLRSGMAAAEAARQERDSLRNNLRSSIDSIAAVHDALLLHPSGTTCESSSSNEKNDPDGDSERLRHELVEVSSLLSLAGIGHRDAVESLRRLSSDLVHAQEAIISLERDKKAHAAAKRFREAAVAAKDEKTSLDRKEELEQLVVERTKDASERSRDVENLAQKQNTLKRQLEETKRTTESSRLSLIAARADSLSLLCDQLRSRNSGGGIDGHAVESPVARAMLRMLETELSLLDLEADGIRRRIVRNEETQHEVKVEAPSTQILEVEVASSTHAVSDVDIVADIGVSGSVDDPQQILLAIHDLEASQNDAIARCHDYELAATTDENLADARARLALSLQQLDSQEQLGP